MKFTIDSKKLKEEAGNLSRFLPTKPITPVFDGILLTAKNKTLTFVVSNGEISVKTDIPCDGIQEDGSTLFIGRCLLDLFKNVPDGDLTFTQSNEHLVYVQWKTGNSTMATDTADNYPKIEFPDKVDDGITFDSKLFGECLSVAAGCVLEDDLRPAMRAVLIDCTTNGCAFVGTDSRRLSIISVPEAKASQDCKMLVPGDCCGTIRSQLKDEKTVIGINGKNFVAISGSSTVLCRTVEGKFPDWKTVIPKDPAISVELNTKKLAENIGRVSMFSDGVNKAVKLTIDAIQMLIDGNDLAKQTKGHESMECESTGLNEPMVIGFKSDLLLGGLKNITDEKCVIKIWSNRKAVIIKGKNAESRLNYILMPIAI